MLKAVRIIKRSELGAVALSVVVRVVSGPSLLLLIPLFLSVEAQGYWYTFTSLSALSIFADLGFSVIVLQFAAHEAESAGIGNQRDKLIVDYKDRTNLGGLFRFVLKWCACAATISMPVILVIGALIFESNEGKFDWKLPWLLYVVAGALNFANSLVLSFIEGSQGVRIPHLIRVKGACIQVVITLIGLVSSWSLYSLALGLLISQAAISWLTWRSFGGPMVNLWSSGRACEKRWSLDVFPLLKRYAVTWGFGYIVFQSYTPIAFIGFGSEAAGQIGISLALWNAIFSFSLVPITAITPDINRLVASSKWVELDKRFIRRFLSGFCVFLLLSLASQSLLLHSMFGAYSSRFAPAFPMFCLFVMWLLQYVVSAWAVYVRAHKIEPFMWPTVLVATIGGSCSCIVAVFSSANNIFVGAALASLLYAPLTWKIVNQTKCRLHI